MAKRINMDDFDDDAEDQVSSSEHFISQSYVTPQEKSDEDHSEAGSQAAEDYDVDEEYDNDYADNYFDNGEGDDVDDLGGGGGGDDGG